MPLDAELKSDWNHGAFATTHWSMVLRAGDEASPEAARALEILCQRYWYALYVYVRRCGRQAEDARDLTQSFFLHFLRRNDLSKASPQRGRFRSFLIQSMKNHLANDHDGRTALKRGGGVLPIELDALDAEKRYGLELVDNLSADRLFDRRWALTLLDHVMGNLRDECQREGKSRQFALLKGSLTGEGCELRYDVLGRELGLSENGVKSAVRRLRLRYRDLLKSEIANTVANPGEVKSELQELMRALSLS